MNVLVSGGSGLIGSHLVDRLMAGGDRVTVVDDFSTGRRANIEHLAHDDRLRVIEADLTRDLPPALLAAPYDRVYHLASPASPPDFVRRPMETLLVNSIGTRAMLDLARAGEGRFLLASTSEVYGDPLVHPQSEAYWGNVNPVGPRSCYDEAKRFAESMTMALTRTSGLDARIARIFNTYGPRSRPDDGRLIPSFCCQALAGEPMTIFGDGLQTRSFCYVTDLARGLVALMETPGLAGEVVNLGNPREMTILEVAEQVRALTGTTSPLIRRPLPIDDPSRRQPDIAKARRLLGWEPEIDLDDGLRRTLEAFRQTVSAEPQLR